MRDLFYPHVGELNHIGGYKNRLGVWSDGVFSWLEDQVWSKRLGYKKETLVTQAWAENKQPGLLLKINDTVLPNDCVYLKKIVFKNLLDRQQEVRVFFSHDFSIDESPVGDTALYDPDYQSLCHYKRNKYFLINGFTAQAESFYQYATGTKRFNEAEGTWRDAEDGELAGNPISQGSVDSTVSFRFHLPSLAEETLYYWIAIGRNIQEVRHLNNYIIRETPVALLSKSETYWRAWVNKRVQAFCDLPDQIIKLYRRSLLIIRTQIDRGGAIIAANDSDIMQTNRDHYSYMWPRDGALVVCAMIRAGYYELAIPFLRFCENALTEGGFLLHKYNPDGSAGSSWHPWVREGQTQIPIQEDETGLVLMALWEYYHAVRDIEFVSSLYRTLITPAAEFMLNFTYPDLQLPRESYDLWEERRGIFTFTTAAVYSGLVAAANFAGLLAEDRRSREYQAAAARIKDGMLKHLYDEKSGRFIRGIYLGKDGQVSKDLTLESSLFALFSFGVFDASEPRVKATMQALEKGLWVNSKVGGIARYTDDYYFQKSRDVANVPGNPWIICTLWLAEWYIAIANTVEELRRPLELLTWVVEHALPSGILPEQVHPYTGEPVSVAPLTWSHATFVMVVEKYMEKYQQLGQGGWY